MFSLQRILGHDKKFFELLQASAREAQAGIKALRRLLEPSGAPPDLQEFAALRRKDKRITNEITDMLCHTFVTAIEREDLEALATALYKIPKTIEKCAERYQITAERTRDVDFARQVTLLEQATGLVLEMLQALQAQNLKQLVELNSSLQQLESQGDALLAEFSGHLYQGAYPPLKAIIVKDLFELLEKAMDRCRSAGHIMARVALKHS